MQAGHTSIQVQRWPANAPRTASRGRNYKNPFGLHRKQQRREEGADPEEGGARISRISGPRSPSKGTPDAGNDNVGPLFPAPASLPTSKPAHKQKQPASHPCGSSGGSAWAAPARRGTAKQRAARVRSGAAGAHRFHACIQRENAPLLPIFMTRPKTDVLSTVLQFHLRCRNWYWHSLMALRAPSPMNTMCSW
mgnify:CR=1 FL=1